MEIKNLKKAANRIIKAVRSKENIIIYGDADLDGITSVIILKESIKSLGGEIKAIYFPDREKEGYGITENALDYLKQYAPALFIALDCGISNFKEIKIAKKLGFEVIVVDHHEILDKLPEASIIVDPKQSGDKYPFKYFSAAGLAFKLVECFFLNSQKVTGNKAIGFKKQMSENLRNSFLELVALATIADMMPRIGENDIMISDGLNSIESSWRPGIQALFELDKFSSLDLSQKVYKINSLLNVRDIKNGMPATFRLLVSSSKEEAKKLAEKLFKKGLKRKEKIKRIIGEIEARIFDKQNDPIIFEGSSDWDLSLFGTIASVFCRRCQKPVFLFKKTENENQGGARSPSEFNLVEAMKGYSKKLVNYGGHPQAAGFRIKNKNLEMFKRHLFKYFNSL